MNSVASQFLSIALAVDIMVGISNKAHCECLLLGTQGDAVVAVHFIVGGV